MSIEVIRQTSQQLAVEIQKSMKEQRETNPDDRYYVVALVVTDDFVTLDLHTNTLEFLEQSAGEVLPKWYWGEWDSGWGVNCDVLTDKLGEVDDFDDQSEGGNAVQWLAVMTEAMRLAKRNGAFDFDGEPATLFCSMLDHDAAIWLEDLSARYLNDRDVYDRDAPEIRHASAEWYTGSDPEDTAELRDEFRLLLEQLMPSSN